MEHLPSTLTDQNKADLTRCAEEILLAREHYFPATIRANAQANANAEMYDSDRMDGEFPLVREAHDLPAATLRDRNDKILERIYSDRRFIQNVSRSDSDQLEKLFESYTKMTAKPVSSKKFTTGKIKP
jgi:hypothetical protein